MPTAPFVLCYISTGSRIWTGSWMRMNPSGLSKHNMPSHLKEIIGSDICLLSVYQIGSQTDQKCDYKGIINEICLDTPTLIAKGMIVFGN